MESVTQRIELWEAHMASRNGERERATAAETGNRLLRSRLFWGAFAYVIVVAILSAVSPNSRPSDPVGLGIVASIVAMLMAGRYRREARR